MLQLFCCSDATTTIAELPLLTFEDTLFIESNVDQEVQVRLSLSAPSLETVVIDYETLAGTALPDKDYIALQNKRATFEAGKTEVFITLELSGDQGVESDEEFYLYFPFADNAIIEEDNMKISILNDDVDNSTAGRLVIPETGYETPLTYEGMSLIWQDEFDQSAINTDNWAFQNGDGCPSLCGWGNAELQYYTEDNAYLVENDYLVIEAIKEQRSGSGYTSAKLISQGKQQFKYGRIDIRANLPYGQGLWPALWMLGANHPEVGWPQCGEIDIMELIGGNASGRDNTIHGTVHWQDNGFKADYGTSSKLSEGIYNDEFHVFSIEWDETQIKWLRDDVVFNTIDITSAYLSEFNQPFWFIFNIAVGGSWPGSPNISTVFPQYMLVDYIRIFQSN